MDRELETDVLVIGAGIAGSTAALELADAGLVALAEEGDEEEDEDATFRYWDAFGKVAYDLTPSQTLGIQFLTAQDTTEFEETEDLEIRKLPLAEAVAMARRGEITDAISVAALLRVALPD